MTMWHDIRADVALTIRRAMRHKTFTVIVIACLALGIGATTGVFTVMLPVLLRPIPFGAPERLVTVAAYNTSRSDPDERYWMPWLPTEQLISEQESFEGVAAFNQTEFDVLGPDGPERIPGARSLAGSFDALGVRPMLGRTLAADDARAGVRAALISEELWMRRYGRDAEILGQTITLDEQPHAIVGVLPAGYGFPQRADIWASFHPEDYSEREQRGLGMLLVIGRLAPGASAVDVDRDVSATLRAVKEIDPGFYAAWGFEWVSLRSYLVGDFERPLWALFGGATLVLLLAIGNVVNLLLARSHADARDRAVRTALGGRRGVMIRQYLIENGFLALTGAAAAIGLAAYATRALLAATPLDNPALDRVGLSPLVFGFSFALAAAIALAMSIAGAASWRQAPLRLLQGARGAQAGPGARRVQQLFVVGQVALSLVLLVSAGLFARSFRNLTALDFGFGTDDLLAIRVSAPASLTDDVQETVGFSRAVIERVSRIPGVEAVGAASWLPFDDPNFVFNHSVEHFPPENPEAMTLAPGWVVSPGWFAAMEIPLLRGRAFTYGDRLDAPLTVVVNREFERRYWPGESAVGKRVKRGTYYMERPWMEIVGVVENSRSGTLSDAVVPNIYFPMEQSSSQYLTPMAYTVRHRGEAEAVVAGFRAAVAEISAAATVYRVSTGSDITRAALGRPRFSGLMIGAFAAMGLVLATAGVYGMTSFSVGRRTREFALRVALGAEPRQVRALVLRQAAQVAGAGVLVGLAVSAGTSSALRTLLFEVGPGDPTTYALVTVVIVGAVLLASFLPARRATRVDPTVAMREE